MQYRLSTLLIAITFFAAISAFPWLAIYVTRLAAALAVFGFGWVVVAGGIRSGEKITGILFGAPFLIMGIVVVFFALTMPA